MVNQWLTYSGSGAVDVAISRRNTKKKYTSRYRQLVTRLQYYIRGRLVPWESVPRKVGVMAWGVRINGRAWPHGSCCQYTRDIHGDNRIYHMSTIVEYYAFYGEHAGPVFVKIREHDIVSRDGVMVVVDACHINEHVVHIDCLIALFHMAPHFNNEATLQCCLPVAKAYPLVLDNDMLD
jgi:hypothetical protein